jgi:hypothetical protein
MHLTMAIPQDQQEATMFWLSVTTGPIGGELSLETSLLRTEAVVETSASARASMELSTTARTATLHGNSLASQATTTLYRLNDADGNLLKWGITNNTRGRYSQAFMQDKRMVEIARGSRVQMARMERILTERVGGPLNLEPWAGSQYGNNLDLVESILGGSG